MASKKIITIDVGGQLFATDIRTLTKYPDTMVSKMFQHSEEGITPKYAQKRRWKLLLRCRSHLLSWDHELFKVWKTHLAEGGTLCIALCDVILQTVFGTVCKMTSSKHEPPWCMGGCTSISELPGALRSYYERTREEWTMPEKNGLVTLNLNGEKEISILRSVLTKAYPNSTLAKYFSMNHRSPWIMKENPGRYYICGSNVRVGEMVFKFLTTQSINGGESQNNYGPSWKWAIILWL